MNDDVVKKRRFQCNIMLKGMLGEGQYLEWWNSKNKAFDGQTPEEIWEKDSEKVFNYLMAYCLR